MDSLSCERSVAVLLIEPHYPLPVLLVYLVQQLGLIVKKLPQSLRQHLLLIDIQIDLLLLELLKHLQLLIRWLLFLFLLTFLRHADDEFEAISIHRITNQTVHYQSLYPRALQATNSYINYLFSKALQIDAKRYLRYFCIEIARIISKLAYSSWSKKPPQMLFI